MRLENDSDTEDEDEQRTVRTPRIQWTPQDPGPVGLNTPKFIKPVMSEENREKPEDLSTAYDYYKLFQSDTFANKSVQETRGVRGTLALPHPIHQANYVSLVGPMSLGSLSQPHVLGGEQGPVGGGGPGGGGGLRGVSAPHIQ